MQFQPPLPYDKKTAIDSIFYAGAVKVFLKFKSPFWAYENKLPKIGYNDTDRENGGTGVSDDILRAVSLGYWRDQILRFRTDVLVLEN